MQIQNQNPTASDFRSLPLGDRAELIDSISPEEAMSLYYDWRFWARPEQLEPKELGRNGKFIWFSLSGRGTGKTRQYAEWVIDKVQNYGYRYISLIGAAADEVRNIMIEGESGILNCSPPWFIPIYEPSKKRLLWPNGAVAQIFYGSEPDKARGAQSDLVWMDELAKWKYPEQAFDNILLGLRLGENPLCGVSTTPRPTKFIKELVERPEVIVTRGHTMDNIDNLAEPFIHTVIRKYMGTRLGRQELDAVILDDNPNALWKRKDLDDYRVEKAPDLYRIITAVDPEATDSEESSETGIVIVGEGKAMPGMRNQDLPHFYVIDDMSLKGSPNGWGRQVVTAFNKYECDRIIAEKNNGGDMVKSTIHNVDAKVPFSPVWASRGKYVRAEPISALYEQGRVHHVGSFPILEDQLCEWVPGEKSPDRLDALVWGVTWLSEKESIAQAPSVRAHGKNPKFRSKVTNLPT